MKMAMGGRKGGWSRVSVSAGGGVCVCVRPGGGGGAVNARIFLILASSC